MRNVHIVIAGLGNTGGQVASLVARLAPVVKITLCDPDDYSGDNLATQNIDFRDVGRAKVVAQADRLRRVRPGLEVLALPLRIEDVPRGLLACDLILSCPSTRQARQNINEIAARLGIPYIDCGVLGSQNLVRVNAYVPSPETPCLECAWGPEDYAALEQEFLCGAKNGAYPTQATAALGALAASLVGIEVSKLLRGETDESLAGRQVLYDGQHHVAQVSSCRRNPSCRFDHRAWTIEPWVCRLDAMTVREAVGAFGSLRVEGHWFAVDLVCPDCGSREKGLRLNRPQVRCLPCDRRMVSCSFGSLEGLNAELGRRFFKDLSLADLGLRYGDIVSSGDRHRRIQEAA